MILPAQTPRSDTHIYSLGDFFFAQKQVQDRKSRRSHIGRLMHYPEAHTHTHTTWLETTGIRWHPRRRQDKST